jgi:hypothetical protein
VSVLGIPGPSRKKRDTVPMGRGSGRSGEIILRIGEKKVNLSSYYLLGLGAYQMKKRNYFIIGATFSISAHKSH